MMKLLSLISILVIGSASFAASSSGALVSVGFFKWDQETDGPQISNSTNKNTYYDLKIGYVTSNEIFIGGIYSTANHDYGTSETKRTLYGVSLGYHHNGWYLDGSYFIDGQYDMNSIVFKKASGIGLDLGYQYMASSNLALGVQGSYKSYTFKEYESSNVTVTQDNKVKSEFYPMLVLGILF